MIDAIIRGTLGQFGSALLDFYQEYALWINGLFLLYALLLLVGKYSYNKIIMIVKQEVIKFFGEDARHKNEKWFIKSLEHSPLDWESISGQMKIPFFSTNNSIAIKIKGPKPLKLHFTPERIYDLFQSESRSPTD